MAKKKKTSDFKYTNLIVCISIILISILGLFNVGFLGQFIDNFVNLIIGNITGLLFVILIIISILRLINKELVLFKSKFFIPILLFFIALYMSFAFTYSSFTHETELNIVSYLWTYKGLDGGLLQFILFVPINALLGGFGTLILIVILYIISVYLFVHTIMSMRGSDLNSLLKDKLNPVKEDSLLNREDELEEEIEEEEIEIDTSLRRSKKDKSKKNKKAKEEVVIEDAKEENDVEPVSITAYKNYGIKIDKSKAGTYNDDEASYLRLNVDKPKVVKPQIPVEEKEEYQVNTQNVQSDLMSTDALKVPQDNLNVDVMEIEKTHTKKQIKKDNYKVPSIDLLKDSKADPSILKVLESDAKENAKLLEQTLNSFNLKAKVSNVTIGPNITKYELQPEVGTKVSKFQSLSNDIAMSLAAESIRIEAPIPGKAAVGIEVPNKSSLSVSLKEVLESDNNDMSKKLQVALGKDITGKSIFMEINKTPHMLVAGATGSGKSVSINSFVLSILLKSTPDEVKLIMIDPKKVELAPYNGIPHLLTPVVTEPKRAAIILKQMVLEMEARYEKFSTTNTRNIEGFNDKLKKDNQYGYTKLPYIVIIIDELADLMMVASNEVETSIARLAQMARAAGIHLVVATQRPSTDIITGLIKSNIPTRISFSVSSSIDSRTILDKAGADKLLGKGDMLYSENGKNTLERIQGTYVSDQEIEDVVDYILNQNLDFDKLKEDQEHFEQQIVVQKEAVDKDELFDDAVHLILESKSASTSLLQRRLNVGFNRASSIMDQMEQAGIVGPSEGTKPRQILISSYEG
ncbi:MAG: DNA translocase FtsK [Mycoplasmatales bacterium]